MAVTLLLIKITVIVIGCKGLEICCCRFCFQRFNVCLKFVVYMQKVSQIIILIGKMCVTFPQNVLAIHKYAFIHEPKTSSECLKKNMLNQSGMSSK